MLKALDDLGPRTKEKLLDAFGSEDGVVAAAEAMELDRFLEIRGISARMAVDIMSGVMGLEDFPFMRTEAAQTLYEDILSRIQVHAHTPYARNKALLLRPLRETSSREALVSKVMKAKERVRQLPWDRVALLLGHVPALKAPKPVFDSSKLIIVEMEATQKRLEPYGRYCEVMRPDEIVNPEEYDLILYLSPSGAVDLDRIEQVHTILGQPEPWQLFPELVLDFFRANEALLESMVEMSEFVEGLDVAEQVLSLLSRVRMEPPKVEGDILQEILNRLNESLKGRLSKLSIGGPELLELLEKGLPQRLEEVFLEVLEEGEHEILRRTGLRIKLQPTYPLRLPEEEVEDALRRQRRRARLEAFEAMQKAAGLLIKREEDVRTAYRRVLEFDFEMALGAFALEYDLQRPRWGAGVRLRGALHLALNDTASAQRVDYQLPSEDGIALLTGANSGGKTTLLETLAQAYILASMGLPVSAREAVLEPLEGCYYFSRQRSLTAGALEGFLTTFMPLALDSSRKLVLADELESVTEPEAAAAIIATFLDMLKASGSYGVVVTHAARSVLQLVDVRVDGIEARGLDDAYELIVDRTPRSNHVARSTPELILQRLVALRGQDEAGLYRRILERLNEGAHASTQRRR